MEPAHFLQNAAFEICSSTGFSMLFCSPKGDRNVLEIPLGIKTVKSIYAQKPLQ